jgi:SAM-dependent methyltransferase
MTRRRSTPAGKRRNAPPAGKSRHAPPGRPVSLEYAAEVLEGVADAAARELGRSGAQITERSDTELVFTSAATRAQLASLVYPVAVYRLLDFAVPRPKALLGHENLQLLLGELKQITDSSDQSFSGFRLGAAGSDSAVFQRLAAEIQRSTGLKHDPEAGDLLLRFRPAAGGWQALLRLTPRPQSVRPWRVCNLPGGLNATIAVLMHELTGMRSSDRYLNAMCGSGTLLAERVLAGPARLMVGCDSNGAAVDCAAANLKATGKAPGTVIVSAAEAAQLAQAARPPRVILYQGDATATPFNDGSFTVISCDLPWGDAVGSHSSNRTLYPRFLGEARRLLVRGGRLVLLSHEVKLMNDLLQEAGGWHMLNETRVHHSGHYPRIYLLEAI